MGVLIAGSCLLMRTLGVPLALAVPSALLILAFGSSQPDPLTTIRGDSLPAAFCVLGLWACSMTKPKIILAAALFTLAIAAKVTAVYGIIATVATLGLAGRLREARNLAVLGAIGIGLLLATMYVASDGRVFAIFRACSMGGGTPFDFLLGPIHLIRLANDGPSALPLFVFSWAIWIATLPTAWKELPTLVFLCVAGMLNFVCGSPGISGNHLLDIHVVGVVLISVAIIRGRIPLIFGIVALAMAATVACGNLAHEIPASRVGDRDAVTNKLIGTLRQLRPPIFSENPMLPILVGQRTYLLDPFMFEILRTRRPTRQNRPVAEAGQPLLRRGGFVWDFNESGG